MEAVWDREEGGLSEGKELRVISSLPFARSRHGFDFVWGIV